MIKIGGELCYSPLPPTAYGRQFVGLGPLCKRDTQLWNLVYLSCGRIDDYLNPPDDASVIGLVDRDLVFYYTALAALHGPECNRLYPRLRESLKKNPTAFLKDLWSMPWAHLPQVHEIHDWNEVVIERAICIEAETKAKIASLITGRDGNVIDMKFGRGS
jgi:hypothetical protein